MTGKEPNSQTFWQMTHKRANGEWIDEASKEVNKRCQIEDSQEVVETSEQEIINTAFKTVVGKKSYMQENAKKECNEIRARLVEVKSHLEEERLKCKEIEARLLDRQNEMQEINCQVQAAIQAALSQYLPPKTEAETSSKHRRKIAELEAQLHEAEDVITDIRSELIKYRMD
uniref:Uncharacterized protein n=1 Tax=Cajanus cajan TaxID=3821 RepID=A0A151UC78_CAJCA|nr:hypothetical protein KK1_021119 [Cajanus cajan]